MQVRHERTRKLISATAARLFAQKPFHKVRLEDIAATAGVGKGTLYVYFDSKEDLYSRLIYDGFAQLVDRLKSQAGERGTRMRSGEALRRIVAEFVAFGFRHPHFFELMRVAGSTSGRVAPAWSAKRAEFMRLIEDTIRRGVRDGELRDPHPEITAQCIGGMIRNLLVFRPRGVDRRTATAQINRLLERGIVNTKGR